MYTKVILAQSVSTVTCDPQLQRQPSLEQCADVEDGIRPVVYIRVEPLEGSRISRRTNLPKPASWNILSAYMVRVSCLRLEAKKLIYRIFFWPPLKFDKSTKMGEKQSSKSQANFHEFKYLTTIRHPGGNVKKGQPRPILRGAKSGARASPNMTEPFGRSQPPTKNLIFNNLKIAILFIALRLKLFCPYGSYRTVTS